MEKKTKEMMEQFIAENINRVPRNQSKKFEAMTIEQKVERIQSYIDREKMWEESVDKNNYIYGVKNEMIQEQTYKQDLDKVTDTEEKQQIVRKYVDKILLQKSGIKRGHYIIEIYMKDEKLYKYSFWSSGPWHNAELIDV